MHNDSANLREAEEKSADAMPDRLAEPVDLDQPPRLPFVVVGVGASAGGLEAYSEFLGAAKPDSGMAFVLIQHLSPKYNSLMAELLQKHTAMPVRQVEDGMKVEPNHVYVIRPGYTLTIHNGRLHLGEPASARGHRRPVDDFFRSLAEEQRERSVCVILSGTGSNGTAGAGQIKAVGGVCIAQEPETAKFADMPRSLIESGLADFILKPAEIVDVLVKFTTSFYARGAGEPPQAVAVQQRQALNEILAVLRTRMRHDFSGYKRPTLVRRVQRRMGLMQIAEMPDYARSLRQNPGEVTALADDLMIHVTGFFRDAPVWESLRTNVIVPLVAQRSEGSEIRAWITACSSGEEAYTLAILIVEAAEAAGKHFDIKIFATDTAERSLGQARAGIYAGGIESEITPQRLDRFFTRDDAFYHIKRDIRELVVFAPQNVLQDPPFSQLDICTCRNLLIYLESDVQRRVLSLLHFGLCERGTLLLGNSETISGLEDLFEPIDKKHRIFRRIGLARNAVNNFPMPHALTRKYHRFGDGESNVLPISRASIAQLTTKALLEKYTPAAVVIDAVGSIVYYHGGTDRFLTPPRGEPTNDLMLLARDTNRGAIRNAIHTARGTGAPATVLDGVIGEGNQRRRIEVTAAPLQARGDGGYLLVSFQERAEVPPAPPPDTRDVTSNAQISEELQRARDELQSAVEELQTGNEEMKASHEELQSINEELQSANEELETSKEELQSLNEELTTVNTQLQSKIEEVERTGSDLASLLASTDIAVIFLDPAHQIRRFTPSARDLFEMIPADIGRPLSDLARKFEDAALLDDLRSVLERLVPVQREVLSTSGRWYVRRVLPYRTIDNRIDGAVITFVEISERKLAEESLRKNVERLRRVVSVDTVGLAFFDDSGRLTECNDELLRLIGYGRHDIAAGMVTWQVLTAPEWQERSTEADTEMRLTGHVRAFEKEFVRKDGSRWWGIFAGARLEGNESVAYLVDVTPRRSAEAALKVADRMKDDFLATLGHELRTPVSAILIWAKLLRKSTPDAAHLDEGLDAIERSAEAQKRLIDDLLDSSRITSGNLRLEMRDTDLADVVRDGVEMILPTAEAKEVEIGIDIGADVGPVRVDPDRLHQVLWNLLANAVKFTPAGGRVAVALSRQGGNVLLQVSDTGRGIEAAFLPHVFDRFSQENSTLSRTTGGLGLGLSIVKQLVELHAGTISAASPGENRGSTFTVTLPSPSAGLRTPHGNKHRRSGSGRTGQRPSRRPSRPTNCRAVRCCWSKTKRRRARQSFSCCVRPARTCWRWRPGLKRWTC